MGHDFLYIFFLLLLYSQCKTLFFRLIFWKNFLLGCWCPIFLTRFSFLFSMNYFKPVMWKIAWICLKEKKILSQLVILLWILFRFLFAGTFLQTGVHCSFSCMLHYLECTSFFFSCFDVQLFFHFVSFKKSCIFVVANLRIHIFMFMLNSCYKVVWM